MHLTRPRLPPPDSWYELRFPTGKTGSSLRKGIAKAHPQGSWGRQGGLNDYAPDR